MRNQKEKRRRVLIGTALVLFLSVLVMAQLLRLLEGRQEQIWEEAGVIKQEGFPEQSFKGDPVEKAELLETLRENKQIYEEDDPLSVVTMYLTVREGNTEDNTNHTWTEVNTNSAYYYDENGLERYNCEALLQIGDENGPLEGEVGYGEQAANAAVQIRGQTSSRYAQKNYKIRLKPGKGEWRGQRTIALNKHMSNAVRFSNKMAYDLIREVPQMIGARTQFVHLYVKDETEGGSGLFEDYGLYTQVEQMNKTYLKNHGLDNRGQLYKVNFFEWYRYEDVIRLKDDPAYDLDIFEDYLEVKGNDDHSKLIQVLEEVNDYTIPIQEIVDRHFDLENLMYWAAFHILIGNYDTGARNLYLYSPLNSEKFYMISWDNDVAFSRTEQAGRNYVEGQSWEQGITQFVGSVLFRRIFQVEAYRKALDDAVNDLRANYMTREQVDRMAEDYRKIIEPYLFAIPDAANKRVESQEEYRFLTGSISTEVEQNYFYYRESLQKPWPFFIGVPFVEDGRLHVNWDMSYDLDEERITYNVVLARDYNFTQVIARQEGIRIPGAEFDSPGPGSYYLRVQAVNESGYVQDCFDYVSTENNGKAYGAYAFSIDESGRVSVPEDVSL